MRAVAELLQVPPQERTTYIAERESEFKASEHWQRVQGHGLGRHRSA
jgi:hypothetical protein